MEAWLNASVFSYHKLMSPIMWLPSKCYSFVSTVPHWLLSLPPLTLCLFLLNDQFNLPAYTLCSLSYTPVIKLAHNQLFTEHTLTVVHIKDCVSHGKAVSWCITNCHATNVSLLLPGKLPSLWVHVKFLFHTDWSQMMPVQLAQHL